MTVGNANVLATGVPLEGSPGTKDMVGGKDLDEWLSLARRADEDSSLYWQSELQQRVRSAVDHFNSRHAAGSKFAQPGYPSLRSKLFRPKTRALINKMTAQGANAFFATSDVVQIEAANKGDQKQVEAAKFRRSLLNHHLSRTVPWFRLLSAALIDADTVGVAITRSWWRRESVKTYSLDEMGQPIEEELKLFDCPWVSLVPIEDFGLHPQCDWLDPIGSSPYIIHREYRSVESILAAIERQKDAGGYGPAYLPLSRTELETMATTSDVSDRSGDRAKRNAGRTDPAQQQATDARFRMLLVHMVTMRVENVDWYYETIGSQAMLSKPVPLSIAQFGWPTRGYSMGSCWIAPHSAYPEGSAGLNTSMQQELNENVNQRIDNIRQTMNSRHLVRRGSAVDLNALMRSTPGSIVLTGDPNGDVRPLPVKEFSNTVYQEADRIGVEMDDLAGVFGGASVQTNRQLSQTVGGMDLLGENANVISEFKLRCFSETLIEPTLRQLDELITKFETDEAVIEICIADSMVELDPQVAAEIDKQFPKPEPPPPPAEGQPPPPEPEDTNKPARDEAIKVAMQKKALEMFRAPMRVSTSVGFGNTSPQKRLERMSIAMQNIQAFAPMMLGSIDPVEVVKEVMGAAGFDNGSRFFPALRGVTNPVVEMLQQQVQQLQQQLEQNMAREQVKVQIAQINAQTALQVAQIRNTGAEGIERLRAQLKAMEFQHKQRMDQIDRTLETASVEVDKQRLYLEREALSHSILTTQREFDMQMQAVNQQKRAIIDQQQMALAKELQTPGSGPVDPIDPFPNAGTPDIGGTDRSGVMARGNFGAIPGVAEQGPGR
jgi:hypothetical protein